MQSSFVLCNSEVLIDQYYPKLRSNNERAYLIVKQPGLAPRTLDTALVSTLRASERRSLSRNLVLQEVADIRVAGRDKHSLSIHIEHLVVSRYQDDIVVITKDADSLPRRVRSHFSGYTVSHLELLIGA